MSLHFSHSYSVKLKWEILKELVSTFHLKWFATSRSIIAIECAPMRPFRTQLHILSHSIVCGWRMPSLSALVERVLWL